MHEVQENLSNTRTNITQTECVLYVNWGGLENMISVIKKILKPKN